jgi:(heptosyl)LPS beta-1,4-glucosyltransferase
VTAPTQQAITTVILTLNEIDHLEACIESVRWSDEILVFDSGVTPAIPPMAEKAGARVILNPFINYTAQRNAALDSVGTAWTFFLDADERCTPELAAEIRGAVADEVANGYWIPRHNDIFGKIALYAGWYPDYQLRLMATRAARYDTARAVHETVILQGTAAHLKNPLIHYNYRDGKQFANKQRKYTNFAVEEMLKAGQRASFKQLASMPIRHFLWRYITLKGYQGGWHGFRLSAWMAFWENRKYTWLRQRQPK